MNTRKRGILFASVGSILWGSSGIAGQYLLSDGMIAPEWLTFFRLLLAGLLLLGLVGMKGESIWAIWKHRKDRNRVLLFGALGMLFTQYGYFMSIKYSNAPTATVLEYLMPILIIFWNCMTEKRWPYGLEIFCTLFAFVGTLLIATRGDFTALAISPEALFWGLLAAVACALYTIAPVEIIKKYGAPLVIGWGMCIAAVVLAPVTACTTFTGEINTQSLLAFLYVVFFGTIFSFVLYLGSTKYISPAEASIVAALEPLSSVIFAFLIFGLTFGAMELLGMALIILAVGVVAGKSS